jgi:hypothetical protein
MISGRVWGEGGGQLKMNLASSPKGKTYMLQVTEIMPKRRGFEPSGEETTGEWIKLDNEEFHN